MKRDRRELRNEYRPESLIPIRSCREIELPTLLAET